MPQQRLPMRKMRDVLRLTAAGLSKRKIAASLGISATAAGGLPAAGTARRRRLAAAGGHDATRRWRRGSIRHRRRWPRSRRGGRSPTGRRCIASSSGQGVTLQLLWEEHRAAHPDGYGYSRFCELYRAWEKRLSPTMRQTHVAGERLFVDYAGTTHAGDRRSDRRGDRGAAVRRRARRLELHLCRGDLDAGPGRLDRLAHARLRLHRRRPGDGGVRQSASRASPRPASTSRRSTAPTPRWRPTTTPPSCRRGRTSRATRPRSRSAVQVATRWIIAKLRNRQLLLARRVERRHRRDWSPQLNARVIAPSRREPPGAVRGAGAAGAQAAAGRTLRLRRMEGMHGSGSTTTSRSRSTTTRCRTSCCARRCGRASRRARSRSSIAASALPRMCARHRTASTRRCASTCRRAIGAMPTGRRSASGGRPARSGASTSALVEIILRERTHPEQGFRACVGILRLAKTHGRERLEAACGRALEIGARSYTLRQLDPEEQPRSPTARHAPRTGRRYAHDNIRGPGYFH